ncbi:MULTISPECIES: GTP 3',8-cyclase MoaA [Burkholderia]|uniref:GTP 3',8-cyclase n=2 Tax=Burkholderia contaminans TaxID=488447 RepID=A0A1R1W227_9BURK|nr:MULTISPECIES: GTP 3',8-cyclase MoaA [Burkholderia]KKL42920.1 molybdenum cofactor biosynthesis protein MoeA [Burkholderia contaminans LMG 23361]MBA9831765.1 GTP 3',8-cyclase MoaA [Burkholderia contaminans]MBA9842432.1 GTP 3',8-cyclase MoaA [Burkholderia contaminans]MBA9864929.1 GTP 3',8-cyclase MoaA [Burkholderia contaminans]MBA9908036.1 GTP 3',8-cyclase MoaA [Burkholderia contaminans]
MQADEPIVNAIVSAAPAAAALSGGASPGAFPRPSDTLGRPLRDLRLSVIDQCNFRCGYCMPRESFGADYAFMPSSERLSFAQLEKIARAFTSLGVEKIRITGGEPLLRRNLEALIERLAALTTVDGKPVEIALTTNGSLLAAKARTLRDAGLSRVTVSLDALDDAVFRRMSDTDVPVSRVLAGIEAAQAAGLAPVKVNAVIERGANDDQILPLVRHFRHTGVAVRFIEYMDVGGASFWSGDKVVTAARMRELIDEHYPLVLVGEPGHDATAIRCAHIDGAGEVGFIASVSHPFCGTCSRARVSADGQLYTCLFATQGTDLRPWLDDAAASADLAAAVRDRWTHRDDRYSERRAARPARAPGKTYPTVRMSLVGG